MLRPRNEVRRLKVAPRKAKPFAEIKSGVLTISKIKNFFSGLQRSEEALGPPRRQAKRLKRKSTVSNTFISLKKPLRMKWLLF
ncbi:hypothetical protein B4U37_12355 [Sutcliffiella horikoshii]|uniref:Ribosomal protein S18 n=1 Tax=Sutcliffiella horikoshii TaxID=79883 RepID=A0ABM6KJL6_9BACI|nr:hypothetical protein B4U37_12355 [Sutcliffiella horikoshii]